MAGTLCSVWPDPFRMNFLTIQKDEEINLQATHMCSYLKKEK